MATDKRGVFVREATGLVKEFSLADAIYIGVGIGENIPVGFPLIFTLFVFLFPTADLLTAIFIGFLGNLAIAAVFSFMSVAMARSGGDYVWTSRVIGPLLGFANNLAFFTAVIAAAIGFVCYQFATFFLTTSLQLSGAITGNQQVVGMGNWISGIWPSFLINSLVLVAMFGLSVFGLRMVRKALAVLTILTVIATFAIIYVFVATPNLQFINEFNGLKPVLGSTYDTVINAAKQNGWTSIAPTLIGAFLPLVFTFNLYGGFNFQAYNSGEIKRVSRNLPISIFIALVLGLVMWGLLAYAVPLTLGHDFLQASSYLYFTNSTAYSATLTQPPTMITYVTIITANNPVLWYIITLGWTASYFVFPLAYFQVLPRILFAWSFDRILPESFSRVSEKYHTPIVALLVTFILMEAWVAIYTFGSWIAGFVNWTLIFGVLNIPWGVAALLFPYLKKGMFESSPSFVKARLAGIPVVSIIGAIVTILGFASIYFDLLTPAYSGPIAPLYLILTASPYIVGGLIYVGSKFYRKSRGVDISLAFREIPPE